MFHLVRGLIHRLREEKYSRVDNQYGSLLSLGGERKIGSWRWRV